MAQNKILNTLIDVGLTKNEAELYFTCLSLGPTTPTKVARASGIKRTTTYSVLESLKRKGLISIEIKGFKTLFVAENPQKLYEVINFKQKNLGEILSDLETAYNMKGIESSIKFYEGLENVKAIYSNILKEIKPKDEYMVISNYDKWYNLDPEFFQNFIEKRTELNLNIRILVQDSSLAQKYKLFEKRYNRIVKFLPEGTDLSTNLIILPHKIIIHQLNKPITATVIQNPDTIKMHREFFEIIWNIGSE